MKKIIIFISYIFITFSIFAQNYYEIPYVGKRSKLTKLTLEEENKFVKENSIKRIYEVPKLDEKDHYGFFTEEEDSMLWNHDIYAELMGCYREDIPDETGNFVLSVYRLMYDFKTTTNLNLDENDKIERKCLGQILYVPSNGKFIQYDKLIYFSDVRFKGLQSTIGVEANNYQFRICGENVFVFKTKLWITHSTHGLDEETMTYEMDRQSENLIFRTGINNLIDKTPVCEVKVDYPLIDKNNPFKYSAQNAYDGDPSTSYVEDTENDLFEIKFNFEPYKSYYSDKKVSGIYIINGYALNDTVYLANNRIKKIIYGSKNNPMMNICSDNKLEFQFFVFERKLYRLTLQIDETYAGKKYSDTCLAEINLVFDDSSLFF